jgi:hypothetical protein
MLETFVKWILANVLVTILYTIPILPSFGPNNILLIYWVRNLHINYMMFWNIDLNLMVMSEGGSFKRDTDYMRVHVFLTYSVTHVRNSEMKQLWPLFFAMLWDIDLIFGMWVYNDKLQIKFMFRCSMIFGRIMALGLWNLIKYLVVTTFFRYAWRYWLGFWYMSV